MSITSPTSKKAETLTGYPARSPRSLDPAMHTSVTSQCFATARCTARAVLAAAPAPAPAHRHAQRPLRHARHTACAAAATEVAEATISGEARGREAVHLVSGVPTCVFIFSVRHHHCWSYASAARICVGVLWRGETNVAQARRQRMRPFPSEACTTSACWWRI